MATAGVALGLGFALLGGFAAGGAGSAAVLGNEPAASVRAVASIPPEMLVLYRQAGAAYGIDWTVLAAIGAIESDHDRSSAPGVHAGLNAAGCCAGPMQFKVTEPGNTWAAYGVDGNGNGRRDVYDPADAIPSAARYLRANGAPADYARAIYRYNHAAWYVREVLALAASYRGSDAQALDQGGALADVLSNPRIVLTRSQRSDLANGLIDSRLVLVLAWIGEHHTVVITALRSDHPALTEGGRPSNHAFGRAADIGSVDGQRCTGTRTGTCGRLAVELTTLPAGLEPTELIYCFDADGPGKPNAFALPGSLQPHPRRVQRLSGYLCSGAACGSARGESEDTPRPVPAAPPETRRPKLHPLLAKLRWFSIVAVCLLVPLLLTACGHKHGGGY